MAGEPWPLATGAPRVWTIPPGSDFLGSLASVLAEATGLTDQADALAEAIIYVPNRRSARALTLALFDTLGPGRTLLAPDIRTLGDLEAEEPTPMAEAGLADFAPPLSAARRLGVLAQLVSAFFRAQYGRDLPPASALASARELSRLLEQASLSEPPVDWSNLNALVEHSDLAVHWDASVRFLSIITEAWPRWLAENNVSDPFRRRLEAAKALAHAWEAEPPAGPVVIAGSTGATPAGRVLMKAAMSLQRGLVVLPGLDRELSAAALEAVGKSPSHPQFTLVRTLGALGIASGEVAEWPMRAPPGQPAARRRLLHEALAPADDTADWRETLEALGRTGQTTPAGFVTAALEGLSVVELPSEAAEAEAAAILLRGVLVQPGLRGALVTTDAGLARRTGALLERWGVSVPPSAGQPLGRTPAGSLIALCARWVCDPADPVTLSAVLKHAFVREKTAGALLDLHFLRGARRWQTLADLARLIETAHERDRLRAFTSDDQARAADFVRGLCGLFSDLQADFSRLELISLRPGAEKIAALAGAISQTPFPWTGEDGAGAAQVLERIREMGEFLGEVSPQQLSDLIEAECSALTVSLGQPEHPQLSIWGPLEARLQTADLIVLAGLNEGVWPEKAPPDSFLPSRFRPELGLPDAEERLGLSAHDFAQLACAPRVVILHSARRDDAPAVASRWVWRLRTLVQGALSEGASQALSGEHAQLPDWVRDMQSAGTGSLVAGFSAEPRPTRRPGTWPNRLSVTRVDRLQRDPYSIWAEDVLGLRVLDPMNSRVQASLKGTAIHKAIERYTLRGGPRAGAGLIDLLGEELLKAGEGEADWLGRKAIWEDVANWFEGWAAGRDTSGGLALEASGLSTFEIAGAPFSLSAQADRIETGATGAVTIVDFKTGSAPTDSMIRAGFDQQMPLQGLIARRGGFKGVAAAPVAALEYVEFKGRPGARMIGPGKEQDLIPERIIASAEQGLKRLIEAYRDPQAVFASAPRVQFVKYDYGYNLLARRAEWASDTSEGGDE
ncbi:MAG: double-strand break repair protein AddB [Hyphomonas sp.]